MASRIKSFREQRGWTQADLAARSGVSRSAVSAIEMDRLVPSVAGALALASALGITVEELFATHGAESTRQWAWPPRQEPCRYWEAEVGRRTWLYPVEPTAAGELGHDGVFADGAFLARGHAVARRTLVLASCDPAAALLAEEISRNHCIRVIVLPRSSRKALALLAAEKVHAAGVHLASPHDPGGNVAAVRGSVVRESRLLRVARWQEGLVLAAGSAIASVEAARRARLRWVGREPDSGAGQCLTEVLRDRPWPRRVAQDHAGVSEAVRCGWADAGVCLRLVGEEAGLRFLPVREETYEICFLAEYEEDSRIAALVQAVRSRPYRRLLEDLSGYDPAAAGELRPVSAPKAKTPAP